MIFTCDKADERLYACYPRVIVGRVFEPYDDLLALGKYIGPMPSCEILPHTLQTPVKTTMDIRFESSESPRHCQASISRKLPLVSDRIIELYRSHWCTVVVVSKLMQANSS